MKKILCLFAGLLLTVSCASYSDVYQSFGKLFDDRQVPQFYEPDYERFTTNVRIVYKDAFEITYEYKNVRVDELAILAAIYCNEVNYKKAYLDKIILQKDNSRRATFQCKSLDEPYYVEPQMLQ